MKKTVLVGMSVAALLAGAALANAQEAVPPSDIQATESSPATAPDTESASDNTRLAAADLSASQFKKLDTNEDGKLSAIEAANDTAVAAGFTRADVDKDGYLSKEEFKNLKEMNDSSSSAAPQSSSDSSMMPPTNEPPSTAPSSETDPSATPPQ